MAEKIDTAGILSAVDLVQLVGRYCELTRKGNEYVTRCIDHAPDNNPSFYVSPQKGFAHCFACGAHYDAIAFVMRMEGCAFQAACSKLTNGGLNAPQPVTL